MYEALGIAPSVCAQTCSHVAALVGFDIAALEPGPSAAAVVAVAVVELTVRGLGPSIVTAGLAAENCQELQSGGSETTGAEQETRKTMRREGRSPAA